MFSYGLFSALNSYDFSNNYVSRKIHLKFKLINLLDSIKIFFAIIKSYIISCLFFSSVIIFKILSAYSSTKEIHSRRKDREIFTHLKLRRKTFKYMDLIGYFSKISSFLFLLRASNKFMTIILS